MTGTHPGLLRWCAAVLAAACLMAGGLSIALAEDDPSVRPSAISAPRGAADGTTWGRRDLVRIARRHLGKRASDLGLPRRLWCGDFANLVRREAGLKAVPSRLARAQASIGRRLSSPRVGAIAVISRRGGRMAGHTGIIAAFDASTLTLVSGNSIGRRVAEETVSMSRLIAVVDPS